MVRPAGRAGPAPGPPGPRPPRRSGRRPSGTARRRPGPSTRIVARIPPGSRAAAWPRGWGLCTRASTSRRSPASSRELRRIRRSRRRTSTGLPSGSVGVISKTSSRWRVLLARGEAVERRQALRGRDQLRTDESTCTTCAAPAAIACTLRGRPCSRRGPALRDPRTSSRPRRGGWRLRSQVEAGVAGRARASTRKRSARRRPRPAPPISIFPAAAPRRRDAPTLSPALLLRAVARRRPERSNTPRTGSRPPLAASSAKIRNNLALHALDAQRERLQNRATSP